MVVWGPGFDSLQECVGFLGILELLDQAWEKGSMRDGGLRPSFSRPTQSALTNRLCLLKHPPLVTVLWFEDALSRGHWLLWSQQKHSAVLQSCASLLRLYCASLIRNADSCGLVPPRVRGRTNTRLCLHILVSTRPRAFGSPADG